MLSFVHGEVMHGLHVIHVKTIWHKNTLSVAIKSIVDLKKLDSSLTSMILPSDSSNVFSDTRSLKVLDFPFDEIVNVNI